MYSGLQEANKEGHSGPPKAPKREPLLAKYFLSCVAATVAETTTYPLDLTKTRLQIQGEFSGKQTGSGKAVPYRGLFATLYGIVREEGFFRLWQGVSPAVIRHIPYTGLRISLYEVLRERLQRYNGDGSVHFWQTVTCGMIAGGFGQFVSSPTDLVKVQMQMEGKRRLLGHPPQYRTVWHAFATLYSKMGFLGMWRGAVPNVQRAMLVNMGELTTYDTVKHRVLMNNFPETFKDDHLTHAISSVCSGLVAAVLGTPADVIKTRVMNNVYHSITNDLATTSGATAGSTLAGNTNVIVYRGALDCFLKTVRNEGFFALYKGFMPQWARMAPWSLTFWLVYEEVRHVCGYTGF